MRYIGLLINMVQYKEERTLKLRFTDFGPYLCTDLSPLHEKCDELQLEVTLPLIQWITVTSYFRQT